MESALRQLVIDRTVIEPAYEHYKTGNLSALLDYLESWANASLLLEDSLETAKRIIEQSLEFANNNSVNLVAIHSITDVLFNGWEMDNYAWVVDLDDGNNIPLTSDHGRVRQFSLAALTNKIDETSASLAGLVHLKTLIQPASA